jgi:hypothetical protein
MAKTTARITFTKTKQFTVTLDFPGQTSLTDAELLTSAGGASGAFGQLSLGELLAGSTSASGVVSNGSWSVQVSKSAIEPYSMWFASQVLTAGVRVAPTNPGNRLFVVITGGTTGSTEPSWNNTIGGTTSNGSVSFMAIDKFFTALTFAVSTGYTAGQVVKPTSGSAAEFLVTVGGTSGGSAPTWPTTIGATVTSGGVTFMCISNG